MIAYSIRLAYFNYSDGEELMLSGEMLFKGSRLSVTNVCPNLWILENIAACHAEDFLIVLARDKVWKNVVENVRLSQSCYVTTKTKISDIF